MEFFFIWDHFFGSPGICNDINLLDRSTIIAAMLDGSFDLLTSPYDINGVERDWLYFLVDGIYLDWAIFVNTFNKNTANEVEPKFASKQESIRKSTSAPFGTLVKQWHIRDRPCAFGSSMALSKLWIVVSSCTTPPANGCTRLVRAMSPANNVHGFGPVRAMTTKCTDTTKHINLKNDLVYRDGD